VPAPRWLLLAWLTLAAAPLFAGDVAPPAEVAGLTLSRSGIDVNLAWTPVTQDANGSPESVSHYVVYRSLAPTFPDHYFVGSAADTALADLAAADDARSYYYLVSAVDEAGNEGRLAPSAIDSPPVLSGSTTASTIELSWTDALPDGEVASYEVHYGVGRRHYVNVQNVGTNRTHSLNAAPATGYFFKVSAVDQNGDRSPFSNEFSAALDGTLDIRAQEAAHLCPSYGHCDIKDGEIPRSGGMEIIVPVDFPEGDWVNAVLTFTVESRLCVAPVATNKCGQGNPGGWDGWNPCGDPWDRLASVTLAIDCVANGGTCHGHAGNFELLRAITPFGTDAEPPDGTGYVPPRVWNYDITPYAPLLEGRQYIATMISTWVPPGWWVTVDLHVSEDPAEASPKPPATGIIPIQYTGGTPVGPVTQVTIPAEATQVFGRLFTTGHSSGEFSPHRGQIRVDDHEVWLDWIWRTDCSPLGFENCFPGSCRDWNACGCPSCTYSRSGWCPGMIACHDNEPCDQDLDLTALIPPGYTWDVQFEILGGTGSWPTSFVLYWY
jgi:hypothetical protein